MHCLHKRSKWKKKMSCTLSATSSVPPVISPSKRLYLVFSCCSPTLLHPLWPLAPPPLNSRLHLLSFALTLGAQGWQVQLVWAQLQHVQQRGGSVPHGQKDPVVHYRPPFWSTVHVSFLNHKAIRLLPRPQSSVHFPCVILRIYDETMSLLILMLS